MLRCRKRVTVFAMLCGAICSAEPAAIWIDVPFVKQQKDGCGAASIAMVMQYWQRQQQQSPNVTSDASHIQQTLYSPEAHGIYASDAERYLRQNGYRTFAFKGEWSDLRQHLEKGRPLIVALQPTAKAPLHYVVVAGIDPEGDVVLMNDPARRKLLKEGRMKFLREWSATHNWTLLAVPK